MWDDRDYLVLSKGHGVMAQYACLHEIGWVTDEQIAGYFSDGSKLKGLSDSRVPGLEVTSGSLGHGLSVAVGLALGAKRRRTSQKIYAIIGDGESNEGAIWEALLLANQLQLDNLLVIVDRNGFQAMGPTEDVVQLGNLVQKLEAFGFECLSVDGHNEVSLSGAVSQLWKSETNGPKAIVAQTIKGKGVSFMENDNSWHYTRLNSDSYAAAIAELQL